VECVHLVGFGHNRLRLDVAFRHCRRVGAVASEIELVAFGARRCCNGCLQASVTCREALLGANNRGKYQRSR
jgi:hypothetical protein